MAAPYDICIRGAGVVGQTLALLLAQDRLRVGLVETPDAGATGDVRAYAINAASRELLSQVRAWPDPTQGDVTPVLRMEVQGDEGAQVSFDARTHGGDTLAWVAGAAALQGRLREAVRYQPGIDVLSAPAAATLTVLCEGAASAARADLGVHYDITRYGQHAIAARLATALPHEQIARQWFAGGEILALLPIDGPQGHAAALVWSVPQERAGALLALPAHEFEERLTQASHHALGRLTLTSERASWPLQLAKASRWCGPGWALAGDTAHTVHPLAGQGLNLGLADAHELARVLREREYWRALSDERLLRRYERARKAQITLMQLATDGLQQLFAHPAPVLGWLRQWGMRGFERSGPLKHWAVQRAAGHL
jgi:2-polyprenyl-6-methoxyphenol hydroxylase-like FAD-dependent oxidoreductase